MNRNIFANQSIPARRPPVKMTCRFLLFGDGNGELNEIAIVHDKPSMNFKQWLKFEPLDIVKETENIMGPMLILSGFKKTDGFYIFVNFNQKTIEYIFEVLVQWMEKQHRFSDIKLTLPESAPGKAFINMTVAYE